MSEHNHESHNVSKLMYHIVFPMKYRRAVVSEEVDEAIKYSIIYRERDRETFILRLHKVVNLSTQTLHIDNPYILVSEV